MLKKRNRNEFYEEFNQVEAKANKLQNRLNEIKKSTTTEQTTKMKQLYEEYRDDLWHQYEDFRRGPESKSKDDILEWVRRNYAVIILLNDQKFVDTIDNKEILPKQLFRTGLCDIGINFLKTYDTMNKIKGLMDYDGTEYSKVHTDEKKVYTAMQQTHLRGQQQAFESMHSGFRYASSDPKTQEECESFRRFIAPELSKDKDDFASFADELEKAKTGHDSKEYKEIIKIVKMYGKIDEIPLPNKEDEAMDISDMRGSQKQAFKMFTVKKRLEAYLEHKAKDGVKANTAKKLAAVEKLNQFLGKRIAELNPGDLKVGSVTFKQGDVHRTYKEELISEARKNEGMNLVDSSLQETEIQTASKAVESKGLKGNDFRNFSSCMDRIMLKAQLKHPKNLKDLENLKKSFYSLGKSTTLSEQTNKKENVSLL